jgi:hypothetical protein
MFLFDCPAIPILCHRVDIDRFLVQPRDNVPFDLEVCMVPMAAGMQRKRETYRRSVVEPLRSVWHVGRPYHLCLISRTD